MPWTAMRSSFSSTTIESAENDTVPSGRKIGSGVPAGAATEIASGSAGAAATASARLPPGCGGASSEAVRVSRMSKSGWVPRRCVPALMSRVSVRR